MKKDATTSKRSHPSNNNNELGDEDVETREKNDVDSKKKKSKISFCSVVVAEISKEVLEQVWAHYRSYLESEEEAEEDESADIDELYEIIHILEGYVKTGRESDETSLSFDVSRLPEFHLSLDTFDTQRSLLPALLSMTHLHIGNHLISQGFQDEVEKNDSGIISKDDESIPLIHLYKSIYYFPFNASALSILANYKRMNRQDDQRIICDFYEHASANAKLLRDLGLSILNHDNEHYKDDIGLYKEWVELLFLDGMCGVEFIGEDEEDGQDECDDIKRGSTENNLDKGLIENDVDNNAEYSMSGVESIASFMSAMLNSTLGNHDRALSYLKKFSLSHRIHPNVWSFSMNKLEQSETKSKGNDDSGLLAFSPKIFKGDVLPQHLYERMCNTFHPKSSYWKESGYQNRGYYSFFNDLNEKTMSYPSNLIEDVVVNCLLPIVKQEIPDQANNVVGFEWWTHTRPLSANLGHQLHFDTDEALLDQKKEVTHPIVSSVLYLTGNKDNDQTTAGSTIVFNQTPDSETVASKAYVSHAYDNSYMIFPGNCLHGVLPCPGRKVIEETEPVERLTFMVGFWTRRVPDNIKEQTLYSPCSPMPPNIDDHSWVKEISTEYEDNVSKSQWTENTSKLEGTILPTVEPAWEKFESRNEKVDQNITLGIPCTLDHRFFVDNAPGCFRDSLFKSDESF